MLAGIRRRSPQSDPLDVKRVPLSIRTLSAPRSPVDVVSRVRGEFMEMRGFSPTVEQAARLFDLSREQCDSVLDNLVEQGFLRRTPDGRYHLFP
jgi:hypothetical protein